MTNYTKNARYLSFTIKLHTHTHTQPAICRLPFRLLKPKTDDVKTETDWFIENRNDKATDTFDGNANTNIVRAINLDHKSEHKNCHISKHSIHLKWFANRPSTPGPVVFGSIVMLFQKYFVQLIIDKSAPKKCLNINAFWTMVIGQLGTVMKNKE